MFKFNKNQEVFDIAGVKVGGQPGENPTLLVGSIFYHGHKIVKDEKTGEFDKERAMDLIKLQEDFSEKTKNPTMLDIVASTGMAIKKYIGFISDITDAPFFIDSPSADVKIAGVKYAAEVGLEKRVVYNSLSIDSKPEEFDVILNNGVESAVLLAYEKGLMTSKARVATINKLLLIAKDAGITKPIIDTFAIDVPSISLASRAIIDLKREQGLPCGCGSHNAIATWAGLKKRFGPQAVLPCTIAVNITPIVLGADFILYGPVESCKYVFPAVNSVNLSYDFQYKMKDQIEF